MMAYAVCISDIICLTSRWIIVSPFPPRFLNGDASFFDLCLYTLWPRQFQSRDNFPSPAKTVRQASLCLYLGVWIIVSPLPPRFLKRDATSSLMRIRMLQFYARVVVELELRYQLYRSPLTLGAHAQRGLVCLSVCPSVTTFFATTRNEVAKKRYKRVQR